MDPFSYIILSLFYVLFYIAANIGGQDDQSETPIRQ